MGTFVESCCGSGLRIVSCWAYIWLSPTLFASSVGVCSKRCNLAYHPVHWLGHTARDRLLNWQSLRRQVKIRGMGLSSCQRSGHSSVEWRSWLRRGWIEQSRVLVSTCPVSSQGKGRTYKGFAPWWKLVHRFAVPLRRRLCHCEVTNHFGLMTIGYQRAVPLLSKAQMLCRKNGSLGGLTLMQFLAVSVDSINYDVSYLKTWI